MKTYTFKTFPAALHVTPSQVEQSAVATQLAKVVASTGLRAVLISARAAPKKHTNHHLVKSIYIRRLLNTYCHSQQS